MKYKQKTFTKIFLKVSKKTFDTSDYRENYESGIRTGLNKKVIGMFRDQSCGK